MNKKLRKRLFLSFLINTLSFFLLSLVTITISFIMFVDKVALPRKLLQNFEPISILGLLAVAILFGLFTMLWQKLSVEKPVAEINDMLSKIKRGDLNLKLDRNNYSARYSNLVKNINFMSNELSTLDNLKVTMMSNISHELKTPISVINNYAAILQHENLSDDMRIEYAAAISDSAKKMTELINNILKLNQLENQNIPGEMKKYNLSEQICECLLPFEEVWEEKEIEILCDIEEEVDVTSDRELMSIVWSNLFSNALKFTPSGGQLHVTVREDDDTYAVVEISDTGCGIHPDSIDSIFERFYQCDTSRATDGNGLGLALVKRIIDITSSQIFVNSTECKGTTFTIKINKE